MGYTWGILYMQTHSHRGSRGTQARLPGCMQRAALLTESFLACALCEKQSKQRVREGERKRGEWQGAGARRYRFKVLRIRAT